MTSYRPQLSQASAGLTQEVQAIDERGRRETLHIPAERPLTVYVDKRELVTLMTLGAAPEALTLGYLRNQRLVDRRDVERRRARGGREERPVGGVRRVHASLSPNV